MDGCQLIQHIRFSIIWKGHGVPSVISEDLKSTGSFVFLPYMTSNGVHLGEACTDVE